MVQLRRRPLLPCRVDIKYRLHPFNTISPGLSHGMQFCGFTGCFDTCLALVRTTLFRQSEFTLLKKSMITLSHGLNVLHIFLNPYDV
mmetsp:Transcript_30329/g.93860  ORF Transcript_30329/g.93860 Transcript_30329/m.93860 type:complete len:87 (-) Transcript_30329:3549-3809(-)